jgi:hypothetical protein
MSLRTSRYSSAPEQADPAPEQVYKVASISYSPPLYTTLTPVEAVVTPLIVATPPPPQIPESQTVLPLQVPVQMLVQVPVPSRKNEEVILYYLFWRWI